MVEVIEQSDQLDEQLLRQEAIAKLDMLIEQDEEMKTETAAPIPEAA